MGFISYDVNRYTPKQMVIIPLILLALALASIGFTMATTGMPVNPGIDFSGGTAITVFTPDSADQIRATFSAYPLVKIGEGVNNGKYVTFGPMDDTTFQSFNALLNTKYPDAKVDQIGESFGKTLQQQAALALVFSFVGMSIVVFVIFRTFIPSVGGGALRICGYRDDRSGDEYYRYPALSRDHRCPPDAYRLFGGQ